MGLVFSVAVPDSAAAVNGWVAEALLETDRGFRERVALAPTSCIAPQDPPLGSPAGDPFWRFPSNFRWYQCDLVVVQTVVVPDAAREAALVAAVPGGSIRFRYLLTATPGLAVHYTLRILPGGDVVARAREALRGFPEVVTVAPFEAPPACVSSLVVPPPSCPPWTLRGHRYYTFGEPTEGRVPVRHGGWARLTYVLPDGTSRQAEYRFP
jgi:hypothetical protein